MRNTLVLWEIIFLAITATVASVVVANDELVGHNLAGPSLITIDELPWTSDELSWQDLATIPAGASVVVANDKLPGQDLAGSSLVTSDELPWTSDELTWQDLATIPPVASVVFNYDDLSRQGLDASGSSINNTVQEEENESNDWNSVVDFQVQEEENDSKDWNSVVDFQEQEEENDSEDWNSIEERGKRCQLTFLCKEAGGYCVNSKKQCSGKVDKQGCKGGKKCLCCIPEKTTPTPTTCPTTTCAPCPGPTVNPRLNWLTTGSDRFVRFPQEMNWPAARALCKKNGLDLYHPKNITAVAIYLDDNFTDRWYWLGAKGNGTHQVWFSGEGLTRADPWYSNYYKRVAKTDCLAVITWAGEPRRNSVLFGNPCLGRTNIDVLCG